MLLYLLRFFRHNNVMLLLTLKRKYKWNILVKVPLKHFHIQCSTLLKLFNLECVCVCVCVCERERVYVSVYDCVCFHTLSSLPGRVLLLQHFLKECSLFVSGIFFQASYIHSASFDAMYMQKKCFITPPWTIAVERLIPNSEKLI